MEDHSKLSAFRAGLYTCFTRARDALFDGGDALVSYAPARSFVALSQAPCFQRRWASCYEALEDGRVDRAALRRLFVAHLPQPPVGERLVLGVDVSPIPRPAARTAADRTLVHVADLPKDAAPVRPGWCFSGVVVLPVEPSSWSYYLDSQRIASTQSATGVAVAQLGVLLPLLPVRPVRPVVLLDCGYGTLPWLQASANLTCDQLVRISPRRVFYRPPPPPTGKRGRPRRDGACFKCADATTRHPAAASWAGTDPAGRAVTIDAWTDLHLRKDRGRTLSVLHIVRVFPAGRQVVRQDAWFWWLGGPLPPLAALAGLYDRRFSQEHGYRFDKQDLLWAAPRLRSPEQRERWTDLVAASHNQLLLARPLAGRHLLPWESARRPLTPRQVRRVMGRIIARIGTPARPPRPRGKSPGRPLGAVIRRAQRHPVLRKHPQTPKQPPRPVRQPA